jgi:hypothetical protein
MAGALLAAAAHGRSRDIIGMLVRAGGNVAERDGAGAAPLHRAAENGHADVVRHLLELGVDANAKDCLGRTPLYVATAAGAVACVLALLQGGADVTAADDMGRTAGDVSDSMMHAGSSNKKVDDATLQQIYDLFKHELEQAQAAMAAHAQAGGAAAAGGAGPGHSALLEVSSQLMDTSAHADALPPAPTDLESLVALMLAKFRACVTAGLLPSYQDIYKALDSGGDGLCSTGDIATVRRGTGSHRRTVGVGPGVARSPGCTTLPHSHACTPCLYLGCGCARRGARISACRFPRSCWRR